VDLLFEYCEAATNEFKGRDTETDIVLQIWDETLSALSKDPDALVGKVDWITKRWLFREFVETEKISWIDPWLRAQDLEFHHVDPARSLGLNLARTPEPWQLTPSEILEATKKPPVNTRAQIRSYIMQQLKNQPLRYFVDWEIIDAEGINSLNLLNPFESSVDSVEPWCKQLHSLKM
jgi:proteasome accessory factor A